MAETKKLDFKSARIALTVSRTALTKAEKEFETNCKDIQKNSDASHIKKVRLAACVMEALEGINQKVKKMAEAKDALVEIIIGLSDDALSKSKEDHINELDGEHDKYMEIIRALKTSYEAEVTLAETLLCPESQPATAVIQTSAAGEMFKPQNNLKPAFLDKNSSHLEVKNFCHSWYGPSSSLSCTLRGQMLSSRTPQRLSRSQKS